MRTIWRGGAAMVLAVVAQFGFGPVAARATALGVVFNDANFAGAIPNGYAGSADFAACEFERYSSAGDHYQHVYSALNDTCVPHTNGAPGFGDVSIHKNFTVSAGQYYKAWAVAEMFAPNNARATVKLIYYNAGHVGLGECYGHTTSTSFVTYSTGQFSGGLNGNPAPVISPSGGCKAPPNSAEIAVHFRIHAIAAGASGKAVLRRLKFGRCNDNGDCGNVPSP